MAVGELPEGFTLNESVGELPAGFSIDAPQAPEEPRPSAMEAIRGAPLTVAKGMTFGLMDEAQAAMAAPFIALGKTALGEKTSLGDAYNQGLEIARRQEAATGEYNPLLAGALEVGGAIGTGIGGASLLPQGVKAYALSKPIRAGAGLGGVSGGVYGFGAGEGGAGERFKQASIGTGLGVAGGVAGGAVGGLASRALNIFKKKRGVSIEPGKDILETVAEKQELVPAVEGGEKAFAKVEKALRKDLGEDYETVLEAYKTGDVSLAELNQSRTRTLAQGAAQYSGGKAVAQEFFDPKIAGSYDRVLKNIGENVSGIENYHTTADDLLAVGRRKAAPLYDEAFKGNTSVQSKAVDRILETPEGRKALKRTAENYQNEMKFMGLPDAELKAATRDLAAVGKMDEFSGPVASGLSLRTLDLVKKSLDNEVEKAINKMGGGFDKSRARTLTMLSSKLRKALDDADVTARAGPKSFKIDGGAYARARKQSGEYLSVNSAMEDGIKALKTDSELLGLKFKELNPTEKKAYQIGLGKAIRDEVGKVAEGANPFRRILGSPEKQKRISAVLSPKQYQALEKGLRAEDRLFKMRNEILGGSPTAGKQEAKGLIDGGTQAVDNIMQVPRKTMIAGLRKLTDGLNDKTASKVSEILYETDPTKKLEILSKITKGKDFTPAEKVLIKKTYFEAADKFDVLRATGAITGGIAPSIEGTE